MESENKMNKYTGRLVPRTLSETDEAAVLDAMPKDDEEKIEDEDDSANFEDLEIKTSGERRVFDTGAHRDSNTKVLKGRWDLIPAVALHRLAAFCSTNTYSINILRQQHALYFWNMATESLYLWMEGERTLMDRGPADGSKEAFPFDHLSNALFMTMQLMQLGEDLPIWLPEISDEYDAMMGPQPRYDRISPEFMRRVAIHYQKGGINYGDRNWEKGMPVIVTWDCAARHLSNWLENKPGDSEDHLAAIGWNICSTMHTIEMINRGILPEKLWTGDGTSDCPFVPDTYRNIKFGTPHESYRME